MTISSPDPSIEDLLHHRDFVRALAARLARDPGTAEDLEQEAWLRALESPPRRLTSARGWFSRVLRNLAFERYRRDRRRQRREIEREAETTSPSPPELHEQRRLRERLADSMQGLRAEDRMAIELRCDEGLPPREISARTGVQVEEVYVRLRRGFNSMRKDLDSEYGDRRRWTLALLALVRNDEAAKVAAPTAAAFSIGVAWKVAAAVLVLLLGALWLWSGHDEPRALDDALAAASEGLDALAPSSLEEVRTPVAAPTVAQPARTEAAPTPPEEAAMATGGLLVEVFWDRPRERAAGLPILVESYQSEPAESWSIRAGQDGRARLELPVGAYSVTPSHGFPQRTLVVEDSEAQLEFVAVHGRALTVHVRRPEEGVHVPDAEIWTSWPGRPETAFLLGRTNSAGNLTCPDISTDGWLWARADGLGSSERLSLTTPLDRSPGGVRILLDLVEPAPPVAVTVVDATGHPLPGALVGLGVEVEPYFGGKGALRLPPQEDSGTTDSRGAVTLETVRGERRFVRASAHGFVPRRVVLPAEASELTVELPRPAAVSGTVHTEDDEPAVGIWVRYTPEDDEKAFIEVETHARGEYRLEGLPPGRARLVACDLVLPEPGFAAKELDLVAGSELAWSPRLGPASGIGGRVVDGHGRPAVRQVVRCERSEDAFARSELDLVTPRATTFGTRTDEEGRFYFPHVKPGKHWVLLCDERETVLDWEEDVPAGNLDLLLAASSDRQPTARIAGKLLSPNGVPGNVEIHLRSPLLRKARRVPVDRRSGEFFIEGLNASHYSLEIWAPGYPAQAVPGHASVELYPGELRDLGELEMPPRLVVAGGR